VILRKFRPRLFYGFIIRVTINSYAGGAVTAWLVRSSPKRAVRVRALAGDTVLCSWTRHLTLTVPVSTPEYKWVPPGQLVGKPNKLRGNDLRRTSIPSRGSRNAPSHFMLQKPGISSGSYEPVGSKASYALAHYNCKLLIFNFK